MTQELNIDEIGKTEKEKEDKIEVQYDSKDWIESCSKDILVVVIDQDMLDFVYDKKTECQRSV